MSKVLVDRELLESLAELGEDAINRMGSYLAEKHGEQRYVDAARAILALPAEAEGVEVVAYVGCQARMTTEGWENGEEYLVFADQASDADKRYDVPLMTVAQHRAALTAVTAERDRLAAALSAPDTITAEPAGDYDNLRKQFLSLRMLANSNAKMVHYWCAQCDRETREALLANAASVNAERDTNSMLTDALETAERERDQLRAEVDRLRNELSGKPLVC